MTVPTAGEPKIDSYVKQKMKELYFKKLFEKNDWLFHKHFEQAHLPKNVLVVGRKSDKFQNFLSKLSW